MLEDVHRPQLCGKTPYGCETDTLELNFRRPDFASDNPKFSSSKSRRLWVSCASKPKSFSPVTYVKPFHYRHHVPCPHLRPVSSRRTVKMSRRYRNDLANYLCSFACNLNILVTSSGQPSPQSSIASFIFSSSSSSSSRSPPSSQESFTETSPYLGHLARRQPRIQVSSLLADPFTRTYHLEVVQQPQKTAEFGQSALSRLPLTPPIIARLTVRDSSGNTVVPEAELPFLIAHLSLFSADGLTPLDMGSHIGRGGQSPPILYGNLVSSIDQLEDLQGNMGLFFVFPDASVRWRGQFQLGITVMRISRSDSSGGMSIANQGTVLAEARTRTFDVLPYSQYTAAPRTRLTNSFLRQGARMFMFMAQNT